MANFEAPRISLVGEPDIDINEEQKQNSIIISNIPKEIQRSDLFIHFQEISNGGGEVNEVIMLEDGKAEVIFDEQEVADRVLTKQHKLNGVLVHLEPYPRIANDVLPHDVQVESDLEPVVLDVEPKLMHILHNKVRTIEGKYKMIIDLRVEKNNVHLSPKGTDGKLFHDGKEEFISLYHKEFQDLEEKDYSLDGIDKATDVYKMLKILMDEFNVVIDKREGNMIHIFGNKDHVSRVVQELQTKAGKRKPRRAYKGQVNEDLPKPDTYAQTAISPLSRTLENGVVLSVRQGDITKENVDVIVNAANERLEHGGGVAGAIVKEGGRQIQQESYGLVQQYGYVPVGHVAWTNPGRLPCRSIFHAVGPQWSVHGEGGCRQLIFRACVNSFNIASQQNMCSIAIPGIGSGLYGVPVKICAEMMFAAAEQFSCEASNNNQLKDIRFVNSDTPTYEAFRREFNKLYEMKGALNIPESKNINLATYPHEAYKATKTERELFSNQTNISNNRSIRVVRGKIQTTAGEDSGLSRAGVATLKKKEQEEKEKKMEEKKEEKRTEENHFDQTDAADICKLTVRREHEIIEEKDSELSIFVQREKKFETSLTGVRNANQEIMQRTNELETCFAEERQKHLETRRRLDEHKISLATERQTHQETRQRISELETLLEAERQIHQEARRSLKELETSLAEERQRTNELETSLAGERQKHQETRQRTSELETSLETERERTIELETSLAAERQTHRETRQRSSELETSLETERQEHQETRGRTNELETTLTAIQQTLEEYRNSRETRDWVLARNEISLSRQVIGEGAWGKVMEGTFRGCKVAVKQIHDLILSPHNRRRFEREMSIASRCRHPCLLQFIGATNDDQSPLFVTELLDTSLRALLQERALDPTEITAIALDIAKGLNYLHLSHPAPIIHRDISSANVLLWKQNNRWRGKVADYGTANFLQLSMTTCPGAAVYSAPESQTSTQTPKVDVYSFGVLLCEMNIRELPDVELRNDQIVMVTDHFFRGLVRRCLHKDPKERPSMKEILDELSSYQSQ